MASGDGTSREPSEKGEKGIRVLALIFGVKLRPEAEAEKEITQQNTAAFLGSGLFGCTHFGALSNPRPLPYGRGLDRGLVDRGHGFDKGAIKGVKCVSGAHKMAIRSPDFCKLRITSLLSR